MPEDQPMTSIFDRWTDLDPALALRRIEAAHGSAIFDKFAYLDPQCAIHQIEDALGIELDDVAGASSSATLEAAIDAAVSDSTPDWVPADGKIYIDLIAPGRAWTEADGEVAIDTLLGTDANTDEGWGGATYNQAGLSADGYAYFIVDGESISTFPFALIGAARTAMNAGGTMRSQFKETADANTLQAIFMSADGNDAIEFKVTSNGRADSWNGSLFLDIDSCRNSGAGNLNAMAFTLVDGRCDLAVNGFDAVSGVPDETDRPTGNPLVGWVIDAQTTPVQSITIYDALPSTAGLSALSATGVTNTAPHDMVVDWTPSGGVITTVSGTEGTANEAIFSEFLPDSSLVLGYVSATDDEGNPLTWSVVSASDALTLLSGQVGANVHLGLVGPMTSADSPYTITYRATDPNGLYAEQQFSITVTA